MCVLYPWQPNQAGTDDDYGEITNSLSSWRSRRSRSRNSLDLSEPQSPVVTNNNNNNDDYKTGETPINHNATNGVSEVPMHMDM